MWVDTHAHLYCTDFAVDLEAVLDRARQSDVKNIIIPAEDIETSRRVVELCRDREGLYCAVGVHPQKAAEFEMGQMAEFEKFCADKKVVAVGEVGLDYYWKPFDRQKQIECFEAFLDLAQRLKKPGIVHNRESDADVLSLLEKYAAKGGRGVMHCFSGGMDVARRCLDFGFYISFAGQISYPKAGSLRDVAKTIPLDRILIETDSPYLSPQPRRGKRNEPANVVLTGEFMAQLLEMDAAKFSEITSANALRLFGLGR